MNGISYYGTHANIINKLQNIIDKYLIRAGNN